MIPGWRVAVLTAWVGLAGCEVTPAHDATYTMSTRYVDVSKVMAVTCDKATAGFCPIQIDRATQRQTFTLPVGKTVRIAGIEAGTPICIATDVSKTAGCPVPPPPPPQRS